MSSEKAVRRMLMLFENIKLKKVSNLQENSEKLIRFIIDKIKERQNDILLQTTSVWILLNLAKLPFINAIEIMLRTDIASMLYNILKDPLIPNHTKAYASELCHLLWYECSHINYIYSITCH
jgi:hypothetical protein